MNKETVISKTLIIDKPNQTQVFDIKIPRDTKQIIGLEMGMRWELGNFPKKPVNPRHDTIMTFYRDTVLGELKLQNFERTGIFYAGELIVYQNVMHSDFATKALSPTAYTHQKQALEDPIHLNGDITLAQGIYKNTLQLATPYRYVVTVYVWLEKK